MFGRWSETIARHMGTGKFIVYMTVVILAWFAWNTLAPRDLRFDPYTFTFLTLVLSLQASYAAPLILLAQNRQADRDRLALEEDRRRASMQKADTEYLAREIAALRIALGEVATRDFLRSELNRLTEDLVEAADRRSKLERKEQRRLARRQGDFSDKPEILDKLEVPDRPRVRDEPGVPDTPGVPDEHAPDEIDTAPGSRGAAGASPSESPAAKKERRAPQGARRATPTS